MVINYYCKTDLDYKPILENGKKVELLVNGVGGITKCIKAHNSNGTGSEQSLGNALLITTATCARTISEIVDNSPNNNLTPLTTTLKGLEIGLKLKNCLEPKDKGSDIQAPISQGENPAIGLISSGEASSDEEISSEVPSKLDDLDEVKPRAQNPSTASTQVNNPELVAEVANLKEKLETAKKEEEKLNKANEQAEEKLQKAEEEAKEKLQKANEELSKANEQAEELQKSQNKLLVEKEEELQKTKKKLDIAINALEEDSDEDSSTEAQNSKVNNNSDTKKSKGVQKPEEKPSLLESVRSKRTELKPINDLNTLKKSEPQNGQGQLLEQFDKHFGKQDVNISTNNKKSHSSASDDEWK